ncbi:hypothetical protein GCM10010394_30800 [Streptomyces crystallinus]|uniref:Uncharacterized protein n=1 Tax=Streptomyces crystallinus TaxID=68191 RepID=A0ABN1FW56_9ACTN
MRNESRDTVGAPRVPVCEVACMAHIFPVRGPGRHHWSPTVCDVESQDFVRLCARRPFHSPGCGERELTAAWRKPVRPLCVYRERR